MRACTAQGAELAARVGRTETGLLDLQSQTNRMDVRSDENAQQLELRITAIEEILFARWPRSLFVRRRLARDLRASVAVPGFTNRRIQTIGDGWVKPWRVR